MQLNASLTKDANYNFACGECLQQPMPRLSQIFFSYADAIFITLSLTVDMGDFKDQYIST